MERANTTKGVTATLMAALSFRVLIALATSTTVTAAVAGPMAYQAAKARREEAVPAPATTTTIPPVAVPIETLPDATTTSTTPTTTSTTSTTVPDGAPVPTTAAPLTGTGLFWSASPDHASPVALAGGLGGLRVWIFTDAPAVAEVTYWLDDPTGSGPPAATTSTAPFDLDPNGVDLRLRLGLGRHSLLAEVRTVDGSTSRRFAEFDVVA